MITANNSPRAWSALIGMRLLHSLDHLLKKGKITLSLIEEMARDANDFLAISSEMTSFLRFTDSLFELFLDEKELDHRSIRDIFLRAYLEPVGEIGEQTNAVLNLMTQGVAPELAALQFWEKTMRQNAGIGGVLRALPIAMLGQNNYRRRETHTRLICQFTHYDQRSRDAALFINRLLFDIIRERWNSHKSTLPLLVGLDNRISRAIQIVNSLPDLSVNSKGFAITTVQTAYYILINSKDLIDSVLQTLELSYQCHGLPAIAGALLFAYWHEEKIPPVWLDILPKNLLPLDTLRPILYEAAVNT